MLATTVPAKAKKRNMVVPINSPRVATRWFFIPELRKRAQPMLRLFMSGAAPGVRGGEGGREPPRWGMAMRIGVEGTFGLLMGLLRGLMGD